MNEVERQPVQRMDQALTLWEQMCFLAGVDRRLILGQTKLTNQIDGQAIHYPEFRRHLLQSADVEFDANSFGIADQYISNMLMTFTQFPFSLYQWSRYSRRVFSLSEDLQAQLQNTNLEGVVWSDVRFPFRAYGIELATPLQQPGLEHQSDFLLVSEGESLDNRNQGLNILMLPTTLNDCNFLRDWEINGLENLIRQQKWSQGRRLFDKYINRLSTFPPASVTIHQRLIDRQVLDLRSLVDTGIAPSNDIRNERWESKLDYWQQCASLVVSLSLYLSQLPSESTEHGHWQKVPSTPDLSAITREAEVCHITSTHPLSRSQIDRLHQARRGGYQMRWHKRSGYWSRRRGEGHDPDAPRVIWHPPTDVRIDRKPADVDSIVGGSKTEA